MQDIANQLKTDKQFLINKLFQYGATEKRKGKYNCCSCTSSDGLSIYEKNNKYLYHCFVCNSGGNVIDLVKDKENIDFKKAVELLANEKGLIIPKGDRKASNSKNTNTINELRKIKKFYIDNILLPRQEALLNNKNIPMKEVFEIDNQIKRVNDINFKFDDLEVSHLKKLMKMHQEKQNSITFTKTLSDRRDDIKYILKQEGLQLLQAPTGSGKTYTIVNLFKELSAENRDDIYIILCPNRVQNQQNGKEYNINIVISGVEAQQHVQYMSAVYEKIDTIIETYRGKNIILVVDEAHELIDSIGYRSKAPKKIDTISNKCKNVIHMTATPRKLRQFYNYDAEYRFDFGKPINNIGELSIIPSSDTEKTLFTLLRMQKNNNKQSLVFLTGAKGDLYNLQATLETRGYKVGVITGDDKNSDLYMNIVENSVIPSEYDVVLATKVLSCGTNIKNEMVTIQVVTNINHFDLDNIEQNFARCRNYSSTGYMILKEQTESKEVRSFKEIKEELEMLSKKNIEAIELLKNAQINISCDDYISIMKENLESCISSITGTTNVYEFDEETYTLKIDYKKLINKAYKDYDKQFLYNLDVLPTFLKGHIKANNIEVSFDIQGEESISMKEEMKEVRKASKEAKEEATAKAKEVIVDLYKNGYLEEYLFAEDKFQLLQVFKSTISENLYNQFKFLEKQEKELDKIEKLFVLRAFKEDFKSLIEHYLALGTTAKIDRYVKHYLYLQQNQLNNLEMPEVYSSYGIIRKHYDPVRKKQGRVTQKSLLKLLEELHKKKLLWQFDKQRMKETFEKYLVEEDAKKKEKLLQKLIKNTIVELGLIYELVKDEKGILISSLK